MERLKVFARYKDGEVIKGFTHDFSQIKTASTSFLLIIPLLMESRWLSVGSRLFL
jgi:hypothetical protein